MQKKKPNLGSIGARKKGSGPKGKAEKEKKMGYFGKGGANGEESDLVCNFLGRL